MENIMDASDLYKAWLHFNGKMGVWEFTPDKKFGRLIHKTRYGNIYGIFQGDAMAPFWIARMESSGNAGTPISKKLRMIEFGHGGEYHFPKKKIRDNQ